jgi:hypothetical protein
MDNSCFRGDTPLERSQVIPPVLLLEWMPLPQVA